MDKWLISFIEDNELGVYEKRIWIEATDFFSAAKYCEAYYPTVYELFKAGYLTEDELNYFTHEAQDQIQRSYRDMGIDLGVDK